MNRKSLTLIPTNPKYRIKGCTWSEGDNPSSTIGITHPGFPTSDGTAETVSEPSHHFTADCSDAVTNGYGDTTSTCILSLTTGYCGGSVTCTDGDYVVVAATAMDCSSDGAGNTEQIDGGTNGTAAQGVRGTWLFLFLFLFFTGINWHD